MDKHWRKGEANENECMSNPETTAKNIVEKMRHAQYFKQNFLSMQNDASE